MSRFQFSLARLIGVVFAIAICCAALRYASKLWASTVFTLTLGILFVGLLLAVYRRAEARAFWVGFSLLGWGYLLMVFGPWFRSAVHNLLLTTRMLDYIAEKLSVSGGRVELAILLGDSWYAAPFVVIGHLLLLLAIAFSGGMMASHFFRQANRGD